MHRLLWTAILVSVLAHAQSVEDADELLRKVRSFAESTRNWRADFVQTLQISGPGMDLKDEVRTKIAAQTPLKMSQQNSGGDRTIMVCDGVETFYSGDGHSYYKGKVGATPQCDLPLSKFYELDNNPATISMVGRDHVRLADGDRDCVLVRAAWKQGTVSAVRTMCIDPARPLILRDVIQGEDERTGIKSVKTTTFSDFESDPALPPDAFRFSIPPGAVEVKPPI